MVVVSNRRPTLRLEINHNGMLKSALMVKVGSPCPCLYIIDTLMSSTLELATKHNRGSWLLSSTCMHLNPQLRSLCGTENSVRGRHFMKITQENAHLSSTGMQPLH
jgi:hypothetical protein